MKIAIVVINWVNESCRERAAKLKQAIQAVSEASGGRRSFDQGGFHIPEAGYLVIITSALISNDQAFEIAQKYSNKADQGVFDIDDPKQPNQQSNSQPKNANQGGNTMSSNLQLQNTNLVKCNLAKRELLPPGIRMLPPRKRGENRAKHINQALEAGMPERTEVGLVRPGQTDTAGAPSLVEQKVVASKLVETLTANNYILTDAHAFELLPDRPHAKSVFVLCLNYVRNGKLIEDLAEETKEGIDALLRTTWGELYIYPNLNDLTTVNFRARAVGQPPRYSLEVEAGSWVSRAL